MAPFIKYCRRYLACTCWRAAPQNARYHERRYFKSTSAQESLQRIINREFEMDPVCCHVDRSLLTIPCPIFIFQYCCLLVPSCTFRAELGKPSFLYPRNYAYSRGKSMPEYFESSGSFAQICDKSHIHDAQQYNIHCLLAPVPSSHITWCLPRVSLTLNLIRAHAKLLLSCQVV